jgi:hypothetical protein
VGSLLGRADVFSYPERYRFGQAIIAIWGGQNACTDRNGKKTIVGFPEGVYAT